MQLFFSFWFVFLFLGLSGVADASAPLLARKDGRLVVALTGSEFIPCGFNFIRLRPDGQDHHTFNPVAHVSDGYTVPAYDGSAAGEMFQKLRADGFNTVRVFINTSAPVEGSISWGAETTGLSSNYLDNVVDFLMKARSNHVFVILVNSYFPRTPYYDSALTAPPANVEGMNRHILDASFIAARKNYLSDFFRGLRERNPEALEAILALDLVNELNYSVIPPFSLNAGLVTAPNGITYDLSHQKQQLADEAAVYWINEMTDHIRTLKPDMMILTSVFTYHAVGRTGPGDWTVFAPEWQNRVPFRPRALVQSKADIISLHFYPADAAELTAMLNSIEHEALRAEAAATGKVLFCGEFGANKNKIPAAETAQLRAPSFARLLPSAGFNGWLYWTYDTWEQNHLWNAAESNFNIYSRLMDERPVPRETWFRDDFTGGLSSAWTASSGWSAGDGRAIQTNAATGLEQLYLAQRTYRHVWIQAPVQLYEGSGWFGINVRKASPSQAPWNTGYHVYVTTGGWLRVSTRTNILLASRQTGINMTTGQVELAVAVVDQNIKVWLGHQRYFDLTDTNLVSGFVSLATFNARATLGPVVIQEDMFRTYPDWLEYHNLTETSAQPDSDTDFDGAAQFLEYTAGTSPSNPDARPSVKLMRHQDSFYLVHPVNYRAKDSILRALGSLDLLYWAENLPEGDLQTPWLEAGSSMIMRLPATMSPPPYRYLRFEATSRSSP